MNAGLRPWFGEDTLLKSIL